MADRNWNPRWASPDELPAGFDTWLFEQASRLIGILRTEINAKFGVQRRWKKHLAALGRQHGYVLVVEKDAKDARYIRFFLKKP